MKKYIKKIKATYYIKLIMPFVLIQILNSKLHH